jgi:hypothetical protein
MGKSPMIENTKNAPHPIRLFASLELEHTLVTVECNMTLALRIHLAMSIYAARASSGEIRNRCGTF